MIIFALDAGWLLVRVWQYGAAYLQAWCGFIGCYYLHVWALAGVFVPLGIGFGATASVLRRAIR